VQKEAERLAEKDIDYYDSFVQRKDDKLFPIFFARNIKPLDYSSGGEEDDEEDDIYEQYRAQNMTDSDEEGELDDEDEDDDDDEEESNQNKNKKKRKPENEKNNNKSNSSNKKRKVESSDKKNGSNSASKNYQSNNNNKNYHQNNNYNNNNNYYNKNNNDNYNYNNNYNNNNYYNNNNTYKQNSNGSGSKNYQQNKVSGYFQQEKRKSFDGKDRDDYQKDNKKARRESGEDRSSVRDMDGVYLENTSKSNHSSAKKASDDWINRLENRQKRFAKTNQN
jgi:hypothetical protein